MYGLSRAVLIIFTCIKAHVLFLSFDTFAIRVKKANIQVVVVEKYEIEFKLLASN